MKLVSSIKNLIAVAMLSAAMVIAPACAVKIVHTGIEVQPSPPVTYSQQCISDLQDSLRAFISDYVRHNYGEDALTQTMLERVDEYADGISQVVLDTGMPQDGVYALVDLAESRGEELFTALSPRELAALYVALSDAVGSRYADALMYGASLYYYQVNYESDMRRYEEYGYSYLLERAQECARERADIEQYVGERNFGRVLAAVYALGSITDGVGGGLDSVTDGELLSIIQMQDFSDISVAQQGWRALAGFFGRIGQNTFFGAFLNSAAEQGELSVVSSSLSGLLPVFGDFIDCLTEGDMAALRVGNVRKMTTAVFARFSPEQFERFISVWDISLAGSYEDVALEFFGEEYLRYSQSVATYSAEQLRSSVGTENFFEILEGYIAGKVPCLAYALFR